MLNGLSPLGTPMWDVNMVVLSSVGSGEPRKHPGGACSQGPTSSLLDLESESLLRLCALGPPLVSPHIRTLVFSHEVGWFYPAPENQSPRGASHRAGAEC